MKKSLFSLIAMLIVSSYSLKAQNLIAVQNGSDATFYTNLDTAIINSPSGSTIYIPGGIFTLNTPINKRLNIFGTGHNPDSTGATHATYINSITLNAGADWGLLTGVYITGSLNVNVTSINDNISNYQISRCNLQTVYFNGNYATNFVFSENIINNAVSLGGNQNNIFCNNILNGTSYIDVNGVENIYSNNIFLASARCTYPSPYGGCWGWGGVLSSQSSFVENNIFVGGTQGLVGASSSICNNNLFVENITFPNGSNIGSNNIVNQQQSSIFVNQSGNTFSYTDNYHLQPTCLGKNAGTDGTDIGIYGGKYPWKDGSIPVNPHILINNIGTITNGNGLPVNIKVEAQDH